MRKERNRQFPHELAMVSISKNEGPYVKEWIEYHKLVGFTKFYFYDNDSEDDTKEILRPYVESGLVEYTLISGPARQLDAYGDAVAKHKDECRWMAFLDMDEYLQPMEEGKTILEIVNERVAHYGKGAAGISMNWAIFGDSFLEHKPQGLTIENFVYRGVQQFWGNKIVKTICNPRLVKQYISPHYPIYKLGAYSIDDKGEKRMWGWNNVPVSWVSFRVCHYHTRSKEQYLQKISRGLGDRLGEYKASYNVYNLNDEKDESMLEAARKIHAAM